MFLVFTLSKSFRIGTLETIELYFFSKNNFFKLLIKDNWLTIFDHFRILVEYLTLNKCNRLNIKNVIIYSSKNMRVRDTKIAFLEIFALFDNFHLNNINIFYR